MKRRTLLITLLTLPLLMGATLTPDSSSYSSKPRTFITNHSNTNIDTATSTSIDSSQTQFQTLGKQYPPCPGDPSNPGFPQAPVCPDINGIWPANLGWSPSGSFYGTSSYGGAAFTNKQAYCPDVCIATRFSDPKNPPNNAVAKPVLVKYFQNESCPAGYVQKAEFNLQPAIVYIAAEQKLTGPFDTMDEFDRYNNDPAFTCDITLQSYFYASGYWPGYAQYIPPPSYVDKGIIPGTNGVHNIDLNAASYADNYQAPDRYCSADATPSMKKASDKYLPTLQNLMLPNPIDGKLYVGQWVGAWTWSQFDKNPTSSSNTADWTGANSYPANDNGCQQPMIQSTQSHHDIFFHYYRFQRCAPNGPKAWYFVPKYVPTSVLCGRVKPVWSAPN